jgi:uncharacterized cupredoxin-like copper-binding protein
MNAKKKLLLVVISALPVLTIAMSTDDSGHHAAANTQVASGSHGHGAHGGDAASTKSGMAMDDHGADAHNSMAGKPGDAAKVSRTINIDMSDNMRFSPDEASIKAGETVRFVVNNKGRLDHEMVIGTLAELKEHAAMMRKMPTMKHAEPNMVTLAPGASGDIVWQFAQAGTVDFACLIPGHMEAGMKGKVVVK